MNPYLLETLESRTLLAGVTLITHGWNGNYTQWVDSAAADITKDVGGPAQAPEYIMTLNEAANHGLNVSVTHVAGSGTPQTSKSGQIIVIMSWHTVSVDSSYSLASEGSVVAHYLETTPIGGVNLTQLPIHEIGHSRGAGLDDAIAKSLGQAGVWVEQETYLDPHTISVMGDPQPTLYSNVEFSDDYWQNSGIPAESGQPIAGAYNLNAKWLDGDSAGYGSAHDAETGYYVGTIDTTATWGGDGPIHTNWYGNSSSQPARDATGFYYSSIIGGPRPASGVWSASGGSGTRTSTGQSGQQWPNVSDLAVTNGSTFGSGSSIALGYIHQDREDADTITYYLDNDQNPYDGTGIKIGSQSGVAASQSIKKGGFDAAVSGVPAGTYYVVAEVVNSAGLVRYDYTHGTVSVSGSKGSGPTPVGGAITGSSVTAASSYNLTGLGTSDWAHWGVNGNEGSFVDKATGGSQISDVTTVGSGTFGAYTSHTKNVSWTDGASIASDADDSGYVYAKDSLGAGYSFTVPASTTPQTLYVYLGGYASGSTLTASLSDSSAPDYVANFSGATNYDDVVAITFNAASAGQTLTINYVKSQNINGTTGSSDLVAAWLA